MKVRGYITHKPEETYSDCADFFAIDTITRKVAVSDGVGQSILPLEWAKLIVNAYVSGRWTDLDNVKDLQTEWYAEARSFLKKQQEAGEVTYMLENCLEERDGAGATFCGLSIIDKSHWSCDVLGDSCLIIVHEDNIEIVSSQSDLNNNRPDYYDSFLPKRGQVKHLDGELKEGEFLLLVSDPFSGLLYERGIKQNSDAVRLAHELTTINSDEEFISFVKNWRENEGMHADDSTLVIVEYDGTDGLNNTTQCTLDDKINAATNDGIKNEVECPVIFINEAVTECESSRLAKDEFLRKWKDAYELFLTLEECRPPKERDPFWRYIVNWFGRKQKSEKNQIGAKFFERYWHSLADEIYK